MLKRFKGKARMQQIGIVVLILGIVTSIDVNGYESYQIPTNERIKHWRTEEDFKLGGLNTAKKMITLYDVNNQVDYDSLIASGKLNKQDIEALNYLREGKEEQLFKIDPNQLSEGMFDLLVNHVQILIESDDTEQTMRFINGLLNQIGEDAGNRMMTYLIKFSNHTAIHMKQIKDIQISMYSITTPKTEGYANQYNALQVSQLLWEGLLILNPKNKIVSIQEEGKAYYYHKLTNLRLEQERVLFDLTNYYITDFPNDVQSVSIDKSHALEMDTQEVMRIHYNNRAIFRYEKDKI